MNETETEINNRHRAQMRELLNGDLRKVGSPEQMALSEKHRQEWVAVAEERAKTENAEAREAAKAKAATLFKKGTEVLNTVTGVRGTIYGIGRDTYKVVRPGGAYVKSPHEQWEEI